MGAIVQAIKAIPQVIQFLIMLLELFPHMVRLWRKVGEVRDGKIDGQTRRAVAADIKAELARTALTKDTSELEALVRREVNRD